MAVVAALPCALATAAVVEAVAFSLGFLISGPYDWLVDRCFGKGDTADELLHQFFVRELRDVKSKIVCLSLKDLDASYSYYCTGVELLHLAIGTSNEEQRVSEATESRVGERTRVSNDIASDRLTSAFTALSQSDSKFIEKERLLRAQEYFEDTRRAATHACNNKGLCIHDRIMAYKLRMAATVLATCFEDLEATITACRSTLKELHDLQEVQRMFSVFFKGGFISKWTKKARLENMKSVLLINYCLAWFAFTRLKCGNYPSLVNLFKNWPVINFPGRTYHPILDANKIIDMRKESFIQPTYDAFIKAFEELSERIERVIEDARISTCKYFDVNSFGDIILLTDGKITVIRRTGEIKVGVLPQDRRDRNRSEMDKGLTVDNNNIYSCSSDKVYVVRLRVQLSEDGSRERREYVLYVVDTDCNIVNFFVLDFLDTRALQDVQIAVDQIGNLVIMKEHDRQVYICDDTGQLKSKFERDGVKLIDLNISDRNAIMIVSDDRTAVHVYTPGGNLQFKLSLPEGHKAGRVAFHHRICKIIVLTHVREKNSWVLLYYSETGVLESSVVFRKSDEIWRTINMKCSPNGSCLAVRCGRSVTFIKN